MSKKSRKKPQKAAAARLSPKQQKACGMLANGDRYLVVAERLDVDADTLRRWRNSDGMRQRIAELQQLQAEEISRAVIASGQQISANLNLAIATCRAVMNDDEAKASEKLSAARLAFEMALKMLPQVDRSDEIPPAPPAEPDFSKERLQKVRENLYGIY